MVYCIYTKLWNNGALFQTSFQDRPETLWSTQLIKLCFHHMPQLVPWQIHHLPSSQALTVNTLIPAVNILSDSCWWSYLAMQYSPTSASHADAVLRLDLNLMRSRHAVVISTVSHSEVTYLGRGELRTERTAALHTDPLNEKGENWGSKKKGCPRSPSPADAGSSAGRVNRRQ